MVSWLFCQLIILRVVYLLFLAMANCVAKPNEMLKLKYKLKINAKTLG